LKKMVLIKQSIRMLPVEKLLVTLFESFTQKLDQIFKDICLLVFTGSEKSTMKNVDLLSSVMASSKVIRDLLDLHPIIQSERIDVDQDIAKKEIIHIEDIKKDRSLYQSEILFDIKKWELLAIIYSGCEHIIACLDGNKEKEFGMEFFEQESTLRCAILVSQPTKFITFSDGDSDFKR
jgi:hypothetical protein